jgi:hypothetical protein
MVPEFIRRACAAGVVLVVCVPGFSGVPGFAQTNGVGSGAMLASRSSSTAAREYARDEAHDGAAAVPSNMIVPPSFSKLVAEMLRRSPTFRRQCQRIANAPRLTVELQRPGTEWPQGTRARTRFVRERGGALTAHVEIPPLDDGFELIAHEIEHVIEQLDGIDLAARAARPNTGVTLVVAGRTVFETTRAAWIGRAVSEEVRRAAR